ncbi:MAG: hypothetical protein OZSIB_3325 [Candidatus Ozemobacter sibiricus]|uniref:Polymerase nucleotidyl transferase domain-containing protein n=1 Tax=Candidatus Ozemobacter sibiricus TaxID=2268124 RepID=A0A367ZF65_9BACT|nr:MAG: hypothetical protein OZSIB_3325 [Candidatus Ozemobacter sibiricus]
MARLDLFGSATTPEFRDDSDLDFLVEFEPGYPDLLGRFLALKERLESILSRKVDLVSRKGVRNPYFLDGIEKTRLNVFSSQT